MKKSEFNRQFGGWRVGQELEMIDGPQKGTILKITKIGIKDDQGFDAMEITYSSGEIEIAALAIMDDAIDGKFEYQLKFV